MGRKRPTPPGVVDYFILIKSDGYPTYNFAHIIDDAEMEITHIIRGQEFISSMPNYLALYEALGFDMESHNKRVATGGAAPTFEQISDFSKEGADQSTGPADSDLRAAKGGNDGNGELRALPVFAHMPHIMNEQGNKKLGKRDGAKDVLDYIRDGYLPEAMMSFIATMGWNDGTEQEVFTKDELIQKFSLAKVQRSGARFDEKRLLWMNGHFIRQLSLEDLASRVEGFWPEAAQNHPETYKKQVLALAHDRLKTLADLPALTSYFFEDPTPNMTLITENKQLSKLSAAERKELLQTAITALQASEWTPEAIQNTLNDLLQQAGQKPGILFSLIRIATTWAPFSPQLNDTLALLGKEKTLTRLNTAINL